MTEKYEKKGYLLEDFKLFHLTGPGLSGIDAHYHEFHKLLMIKSGSGAYTLNGNRYSVHAGDIILVGSRCIHKPDFQNKYERIILYINPDYLRRVSTPLSDLSSFFLRHEGSVLRLPQLSYLKVSEIAQSLEQALSKEEFGRDILCSSLLLQLLVELKRSADLNQYYAPAILKNQRVLDIMKYIQDHLTEELTVETLAEHFYISKYHMMHLFKTETGITLHNYVSELRLHRAKELMEKNVTATEACYHAGFKTYSSFTRAYAKRYGCTPTGRTSSQGPTAETFE